MLTDGQHNFGLPPGAKARELGERKVPIYPIAMGARKPPPDAAIVAVRAPNHTVFKDVEAMIEVSFKISSMPAGEFVAELNRARAEQRESIRAEMRGLATAAVQTVRELIESPETPPAVRLRAALAVLQSVESEPLGPTDAADIESSNQARAWAQLCGSMP